MKKVEDSLKSLVLFGVALHGLNRKAEQQLGLSLVQFHVLDALLNAPGCSAQALARASGVHPSTLTQGMKILARKGLLFIDEDPRDSRRKILIPTREGKNAHEAFLGGMHEFLDGLSDPQKSLLQSASQDVARPDIR